MDRVRVDIDWLERYAAELDDHADTARGVFDELRKHQLEDEAFGEVGRSMGIPQSYQRAADSLLAQLDRADDVLTSAATALREAANHYKGTDSDGARTLERKAEASGE